MTSKETLTGDATLVLAEFDTPPPEPLALIRTWLESATARGVREPNSVVLATTDAQGRPSTRVVSVKDMDRRGLIFTSFRHSRKGIDLQQRPWASVTFYWRESLQQLTIAGQVEHLGDEESDRLFAERPRAAQATTAVSRQSRPLGDETELRVRARLLGDGDQPIGRPADWTGYRVVPETVEFWYGSPDRLHRRLRYIRSSPGVERWTHQRLQP